MENRIDYQAIEKKWQTSWAEKKFFAHQPDSPKEKKYILEMLPYTSGSLHMGHIRNYTIGDVFAHYYRLKQFDVLHPIGFDSFGLPAENAAIDGNTHPHTWTKSNIEHMVQQFKSFGFSYNWETQIATCDEEYYRWNQAIFLELFDRGLVEKRKSPVNYCSSCQTVLANEQVVQGACWRCGNPIILKEIDQWYIRMTHYAEELVQDLTKLTHWPERVLQMQENWIGKSQGHLVPFETKIGETSHVFQVFTTRLDTIFGVVGIGLSYTHPLVKYLREIPSCASEVATFVEAVEKKATNDYKNVTIQSLRTPLVTKHPLTGEELPIFLASYVIPSYGTEAVMLVPAHDTRDFTLCENEKVALKVVIATPQAESSALEAIVEEGILVNSGEYSGLPSHEAREKIAADFAHLGIRPFTQYKLKDWLVSRQRYWGTPIPLVQCEDCGLVPVALDDLPVRLPIHLEKKDAKNPLEYDTEFLHTPCPKCGKPAKRETDTMDTFFDSSWYFLRYLSPHSSNMPFDIELAKKYVPIDIYIGGVEHAILHLLYTRFFGYFFADTGRLASPLHIDTVITQGMIHAPSYFCTPCKRYYGEEELVNHQCPRHPQESILVRSEKMSKSKKNGVDPLAIAEIYGVDAVRCFILFAAPIEKDMEWNLSGVKGLSQFLKRMWHFISSLNLTSQPRKPLAPNEQGVYAQEKYQTLWVEFQKTLHKVSEGIEKKQLNNCIAFLMEFHHHLLQFPHDTEEDLTFLVYLLEQWSLILFPFAPHMAEEIHSLLGFSTSLLEKSWPKLYPSLLESDTVELVIQIAGKKKDTLTVHKNASEEEIWEQVLSSEKMKKTLQEKEIVKRIYIPGKIVNLVLRDK